MSRQYAPLLTAIWQDDEFKKLSSQGQRFYLVALSQRDVSWCGVVSFTARRWATYAPDTPARQITRSVAELVAAGYVLLDEDTEELWIRSFIKHNVEAQPKLRAAASREFGTIHSQGIRMAIAKAYPWVSPSPPDGHVDDCALGVGVRCSVSTEEPTPSEKTPTPIPPDDACTTEARRQLAAWQAKGETIVDPPAWVAKRAKNLAANGWVQQIAPSSARPRCENPDCVAGVDYSSDTPLPCISCRSGEEPALRAS